MKAISFKLMSAYEAQLLDIGLSIPALLYPMLGL